VEREGEGKGGGTTQFEMLGVMNLAAFVAMYHCHHFETALNVSDRQQFVGGVKKLFDKQYTRYTNNVN
jgi:hypothetical protein